MIFATKHSLIQVGRDVGRWASTQAVDSAGDPLARCNALATDNPRQPVAKADEIARQSRLMGYNGNDWDSGNFIAYADNVTLPAALPHDEGVEVVWSYASGEPCPTVDSTDVAWVTLRLTHRAPVVLPGFPWLPGLGDFMVVSTTATYRMEPPAQP